jgi:hypothetical protein
MQTDEHVMALRHIALETRQLRLSFTVRKRRVDAAVFHPPLGIVVGAAVLIFNLVHDAG